MDHKEHYLYGTLMALAQDQKDAINKLTTGTLGFFGLGMEPESADWGSMINQTRSYIRLVPTIVLPATLALASFVLGLNLLADGLREESAKD